MPPVLFFLERDLGFDLYSKPSVAGISSVHTYRSKVWETA